MARFPGRRGPGPGGIAAAALALCAALACGQPGPQTTDPAGGLVFVRAVDGAADLARVRLADGAVLSVTATPERDERWPHWSEAAGRVVYQESPRGEAGQSNLVLLDPATGLNERLPATPNRQERWPAWAPDGRALVYAFRGGEPRAGIALVNIARHESRYLAVAKGAGFFLRPSFAPDGATLIAERRRPAEKRSSIWRLSRSESARPLTTDPAWNDTKPAFSRDGTQIYFTRRLTTGGPADVMRMSAAGGDAVAVRAEPADEHSAKPSPARDEIAFISDTGGTSNVFLADLDGGGARNLHPTATRHLFTPRWSPDGERIAVTAIEADGQGVRDVSHADLGRLHIVVFDRDGRLLLDTPGAMPDWMPPWP